MTITQLLSKTEIAKDTYAFEFEKPQGFQYKAGQFVELTLIEPPETDAEGNTRAYSLTSEPGEETLGIATRMRDTAFKRTLKNLSLGTELQLDGPFGSFILPSSGDRACIFLVGGIGVTPVYSMLKLASREQKNNPLYLFYSNRTKQDSPFFEELKNLARSNPNFHFVPTMTNEDSTWSGKTGYINARMVRENITDMNNSMVYLCGPAGMVTAMRKVTDELAVLDENLRTEEFSGY